MATITMIDYGIGNYRSVEKALAHVGGVVERTDDVEKIANADKLILIGVGAFAATMDALRERDQEQAILSAVASGTPLLGICVGMQVLFEDSYELGFRTGLGLIDGHVRRFPEGTGLKVPHIGWNQLEHEGTHWLLEGVRPKSYAYFVHSYCCQPTDPAHTVAATEYGTRFTSVVGKDNVFGIQFHGEKSQQTGLQILRNYVQWNP